MDDLLRKKLSSCRITLCRKRYLKDRMRYCWIIIGMMLLMACPATPANAVGVEAKVKSAYLYNLLRRTSWPEGSFKTDDSPYIVGVLGDDNLEGLLEKIASRKKVNKRSIQLEKFKTIKDYKPCHMLYVPGYRSPEQQKEILKATKGTHCLVVGDSPGFALAGATANFDYRDDGTIGMELNLAQAKKHKLKFDRQLIEVSQPVGE